MATSSATRANVAEESPRPDAARELRRWSRRMSWTQHRRLRWKVRLIAEAVALPVRAALEAAAGVASSGDIAAAHGVTRPRQWWDLYTLRLRYGFSGVSYYHLQLFRPERRRHVAEYVEGQQYERVLRRYLAGVPREDTRIFTDKRAFGRWCAAHGLASARTVLELSPTEAPDLEAAAAALPARDLFSKPAGLAGGRGAASWAYVGDGRFRGQDGATRSGRELVEELARTAESLRSPVLVQARLENHPTLAAVSAGGLCTARMITIRPLGGEPELLVAIQRMPVGDTVIDSFSGGGVAAAIDVDAGRLGIALRRNPRALADSIARHPTTGVPITGLQLPDWADAVALVERAHGLAAPSIPIVGWDLAFTPDGPVLVEANNVPGIWLIQIPIDTPLGRTRLVSCLLDYLDAAPRS